MSWRAAARRSERKPRPVTIYELEVVEQTAPGRVHPAGIRCSKGTYVRTLCHDIGRALGCGGCMSALRRTMAAGFTLADAVTLERVQLEGESLLQPGGFALPRVPGLPYLHGAGGGSLPQRQSACAA